MKPQIKMIKEDERGWKRVKEDERGKIIWKKIYYNDRYNEIQSKMIKEDDIGWKWMKEDKRGWNN